MKLKKSIIGLYGIRHGCYEFGSNDGFFERG